MNHNNLKVAVSDHAVDRLFERVINPEFVNHANECDRREYAETVIREMFKDSYYLSDANGFVRFRAYEYKVDLLVSNKVIITIIPVSDRKSRRDKKKEKAEAETKDRITLRSLDKLGINSAQCDKGDGV